MKRIIAAVALSLVGMSAFAGSHSAAPSVEAADQSVKNGIVSATKIVAGANGWMVVHRTDDMMKPGPVVGHAPIRMGENEDVVAILTEEVSAGDKLMLMVHAEEGGMKTGIFEYTLGAKEDGPIKIDGKLVMKVITAQ